MLGRLDADAHRHALLHLDEVARGVVLRNNRERRARGIADALHLALKGYAGHGIDLHFYIRPHGDVLQLRFAIVGHDPELGVVHNVYHCLPGVYQLPFMDFLAPRRTVGRGDDDGVGKIEPREVHGRPRQFDDCGVLVEAMTLLRACRGKRLLTT